METIAQEEGTSTDGKAGERTVEEIASGFIMIAVHNMANAVKKISVQRGYDVTGYTLQCFGGAGGQHACLLADVLGMESILIHPLAGVLSAYGMGLADVTSVDEKSLELPLSDALVESLVVHFDELGTPARQRVIAQGIREEKVRVERHVHLRYQGLEFLSTSAIFNIPC